MLIYLYFTEEETDTNTLLFTHVPHLAHREADNCGKALLYYVVSVSCIVSSVIDSPMDQALY